MYYYDQTLLNKKEYTHFSSLDREKLRKGVMNTTEEITEQCNTYLADILTLYFREDYDSDSKEYTLDEIFEKKHKESYVEGYQRLLHRSLILDPLTDRDVRKNLLTSHDRIRALRKTKRMMQEDDLDTFFEDMRKDEKIGFMEIDYLKQKLSDAFGEFNDSYEQDMRFKNIIEKLYGDGYKPWDHRYQNLWNKKLAGQIKTTQEHFFIANDIIDSLTRKELVDLQSGSEFHGLLGAKIDAHYENMKQQKERDEGKARERKPYDLENSPEKRKILLNLYSFLPRSFFTEQRTLCYPGSSIDVSLANTFSRYYTTDPYMSSLFSKQIVHIDIDEAAVKSLQKNDYVAVHDDITTHDKKYDFVFDSRSQVTPEHIDNVVKPGGYVVVENSHAHANYFYDASHYTFIANICNGEKAYTKVEMNNAFASGDSNYYLFKKNLPSKKEQDLVGTQMKLEF